MGLVVVITGIARRPASVIVDVRDPARITYGLKELLPGTLLHSTNQCGGINDTWIQRLSGQHR